MMVEMARPLHHAFWKFCDPSTPSMKRQQVRERDPQVLPVPGQADRRPARHLGQDTVVMIVSDHGAQKMDGGICINSGCCARPPDPAETPRGGALHKAKVDWSRTVAQAGRILYAAIYERRARAAGAVPVADTSRCATKLVVRLRPWWIPTARTSAPSPSSRRNLPADQRHPAGLDRLPGQPGLALGGRHRTESVHTFENDTGPDDANHAQHGVFIMVDPHRPPGGKWRACITDIGATAVSLFQLPVPTIWKER